MLGSGTYTHAGSGGSMVTGTCYVVACRLKAQKSAAYVGGCFVVSIGGTSPSSQSCSLAKASQAASIRLYRRCKGSFVAASASRAQFSAFSRKISDCFIASSCCESCLDMRDRGAMYHEEPLPHPASDQVR